MAQLDPYLVFDGTCAEAMRFYERTLGGKLEAMFTHAETPMAEHVAPADAGRIMHASLRVGDRVVMASDSMPGHPYQGMSGFSLSLNFTDSEEGRRMFDALADGGTVGMPYQETFWAKGFGMLVDRFGTPWMVNVPNHQQ